MDHPVVPLRFERCRIDDSITRLRGPHLDRARQSNIWHVRGRRRDLLVDTGPGVMSLRATSEDLFGRTLLAVATHFHDDHMGGLHEFDHRAIHRAEASALERHDELGPTMLLEEGDVIDLGAGRAFEVLHLPGHSPGSIGLWDVVSGILFSGDAVYEGLRLDLIPEPDLDAHVHTMERLHDLPVEVVHAGHGPSFGRERLQQLARAYLVRWRSVA